MVGKKLIASGAVTALLASYATLDAFDKVPGVLTTAAPNEVRSVKVDGHRVGELKPANISLPAPKMGAPITSSQVKKVMDEALNNPWFGETTAVTVHDAATGKLLAEHDSSKATTPASVTKMASAYAITHSKLPLSQRLTTKALLSGNTLTLVAGGDMTLAKGAGDVNKVAGHAGLGDLAQQTAAALKKQGINKVTLNTNTAYAHGPDVAPHWGQDVLDWGFTARITTLALADDRADNRNPAAENPTKNAADAYIAALKKQGINATYGKNLTNAPTGTQVGAVQSAPVLDLVGLALQDSDNAMIESLTRQAAVRDGVKTDPASVGAWVVQQVKKQGINTDGMKLADASGLSVGTTLPVRILGEMMSRGTSGKDPEYAKVLSHLPVSAWNGTLHNRFLRDESTAADGLVRAKTGSLVGVSSLAGTLVTKGNRQLVFAITTNGQFSQSADGAKAAIDEFATKLTQIG